MRAFLEAYLKITAGPITVFDVRKRFVNVLIASFNHDCPPAGAGRITQYFADTKTLELRFGGAATGDGLNYQVQYLPGGSDGYLTADDRKSGR